MTSFFKTFGHALRGVGDGFRGELNFRIHVVAGIIVVVLGFWVGVSRMEWLVLVLTIAFVLSLELVNSALERVMDVLHPSVHKRVRVVKDMLAAAVLVSSLAAIAIGLIIFVPYFV